MSLLSFLRDRKTRGAAAFDTAPNVATRVLSIVPRYRTMGPEAYEKAFGPAMLEKAKALDHELKDHPDLLKQTSEREWTVNWEYLIDNPQLAGRLAAIVQKPSPFEQVLTEELDEIDNLRAMRKAAKS